MIWNIYFGAMALLFGFFLATALGVGKASANIWVRKSAEWFIFIFRGSPLFIQFFFGYFLFLTLKSQYSFFDPFTAAWLGALGLRLRRRQSRDQDRQQDRGRARNSVDVATDAP